MNKKQILLVDDEIAILIAFKKMFQRNDVVIDVCENVEDAKKCINQVSYDAVIADIRLSGTANIDGFEIATYIRQYRPKTIIALMSACIPVGLVEKIHSLSIDFCLEKPVTRKDLEPVLKKIGIN